MPLPLNAQRNTHAAADAQGCKAAADITGGHFMQAGHQYPGTR
eukprot:gene30976-53205_t